MAANLSVSKPLQEISTFLDNYWNRDQVFRTLQYASTLCSGVLQPRLPNTASKLATFSSSVSSMRTTLRLIDDIPNLVQTLSGWRRQKDSSLIVQLVDFLSSLTGLIYYPTEHIAWAADLHILPIHSTPVWNFCIILWVTSLSTSIIRNLIRIWRTQREIRTLKQTHTRSHTRTEMKTASSSSPVAPSSVKNGSKNGRKPVAPSSVKNGSKNGRKRVTFQDDCHSPSVGRNNHRTRLRVLHSIYYRAVLNLLQNISDMMNAVHYLPSGVLWGGKLPAVWVGVFGTLSSLLGLYKILPRGPR